MEAIIKKIGFPDDHDQSFISSEGTRNYFYTKLSNLSQKKSKLKRVFPHVNQDFVALLKSMLQFNPYYRITAADALKNKLFDKIRIPKFE
jgi:serine/threonine protein kinase